MVENFTAPIPSNEVIFLFHPLFGDFQPTVQFYLTLDYIELLNERILDTHGHDFHYIFPLVLMPSYIRLMELILVN